MEVVYVILLLVIIILLISNKNTFNERIELLELRLLELQRLIKQNAENKPAVAETKKETAEALVPKQAEEVKPPQAQPTLAPQVHYVVEHHKGVITEPVKRITNSYDVPYVNEEPQLSFFERYPDLEKFIGENLVNKIGIAILVLAIGFFVKYAIDNNWIGPVGRVGIGVLCGGILIGLAHKMRKSYTAFSSVLVGGGLAVLYFTITLAYHQFHLFNQTASFIILIVITCFAVALSLLYNKQELAVIALIGGLSSPFMVSNGNANYNSLFIYLILLNAGLLVIAYYRAWRILNITAFALTVLVAIGVVYSLSATTYFTGLCYLTVLYLMFFAINVANNIRENKKFIAADFTILLTNTALYFAAGLYLLTAMQHEQFRGLFSAGLGAINLALSFLLFRNKKVDTNILYLLIGITLTFISLTAPIQLHGHNITLFWAAETVLLYWLYLKSGIRLMKLTALLIWGAMLISLCIDWLSIYYLPAPVLTIIANKGFITTLTAAIGSYLLYRLSIVDESEDIYGLKVPGSYYRYAAFLLLFLSGLFEINHQFLTRYPGTYLNGLYLMLYIPAFVFTLLTLAKKIATDPFDWKIDAGLIVAAIVIFLFFNQLYFDVQVDILVTNKLSAFHFIAHWLGAVFIGLLFYRLIIIAQNRLNNETQAAASWILAGSIVLFLSVELCLFNNLLFYKGSNTIDNLQTVYIKVGLPILWGLASFALMWLGMRNKARTLRIISLTLFSITLIKLFVFDIKNIPPAGKIAAFFCLGVLLLIISFMYQKVKKIIVEDESTK